MGKRIIHALLLLGMIATIIILGFYRQERNRIEAADSFYEKLNHGFDVNILIVGDSISAGSGASDDAHRWPVMLEQYLESTYHVDVMVNNISMGGNTSYAGYVRTRNLQDGDIYDLTILCFGQNDTASELSFYYEALVRAVKKMCPDSSILSIKESTLRKEKHLPKVEAIASVSAYYGIPVLDMVQAYEHSPFEYVELSEDYIHPSDYGQQVYFDTIRKVVEQGVSEGWTKERSNGNPEKAAMQAETEMLDHFRYLKKTDFIQKDSLHFAADVCDFEGILGFDYIFDDEDHRAKLLINQEEYITLDLEKRGQTSLRYIWVIEKESSIEGTLEIEFSDENAADAFQGMVFSGAANYD